MFRNHTLQVRVVKQNRSSDEETSPKTTTLADTMYIVHETGKGLVKGAIAIVGVYVMLDTARQVTVNAAPKR